MRRPFPERAADHDPLLQQRARVAIAAIATGVTALAVNEAILRFGVVPWIHLMQAIDLVALGAAFLHLRRPRPRRHAMGVFLAVLTLIGVTSAGIGVLSSATSTSTILFVGMSMGTAALLPMRWQEQLCLVAILGAIYPMEVLSMGGWTVVEHGREAIALYVIFLVSVVVSWQLEQHRASIAAERAAREAREEELEASRSFLRQAIDIIPHAIVAKDRSGRFTLVNQTVASLYGRTADEIVGMRDEDVHPHPEEIERFRRYDAELFASGTARHETDEVITDRAGQRHVLETTRHPILGKDGRVEQLLAVAIDVTAHKQIIARLAEEVEIAAGLTKMSTAIISSLNQPELLARLCELTVEALGADFAQLWMWQAESGRFTPAAQHRVPAELWEAVRLLSVPRHLVAALADRAERGDLTYLKRADVVDEIPAAFLQAVDKLDAFVVIPLHRGSELRGIVGVGFSNASHDFSTSQHRIAEGLAQLTSLALENALLFNQLERANRLKSDFVATMSHELRTPLNVILGYVDLLVDLEFGALTAAQADTLQRVRANALQLLELINSTLDLSRLDAGRIPVAIDIIGAEEFLAILRDQTQTTRRHSGVEFTLAAAPSSPPLCTDVAKLKVIGVNLIRNALKFTKEGAVRVQLRSDSHEIELSVSDTGPGIAVGSRELIFEAFQQGSGDVHARHGGVGLGLYIVRRLVETLCGSITLESEVGVGSTFRIVLPQADQGA